MSILLDNEGGRLPITKVFSAMKDGHKIDMH